LPAFREVADMRSFRGATHDASRRQRMVEPHSPLDPRACRNFLDRADVLLHQAGRTHGPG
jgi:hypothetical protein